MEHTALKVLEEESAQVVFEKAKTYVSTKDNQLESYSLSNHVQAFESELEKALSSSYVNEKSSTEKSDCSPGLLLNQGFGR